MTRDWSTGNSIENPHHQWEDPILKDEFGITIEDWNDIIQQTATHVKGYVNHTIRERVTYMVDLLIPPLKTLWQGKKGNDNELSFHSFRWLPCPSLRGATVADHALTVSAIAYCLAYDIDPRPDIDTLNKVRLSALTATWKEDGLDDVYDILWAGVENSRIEPDANGDVLSRIMYLAKTVASDRTCPDKVEFSNHPLKDEKRQVGLVLGGATKIKGYFMESAKLPEIRGASALLDRINLEDIPSLFGRRSHEQDPQRAERFRRDFCERTKHNLSAPECIIYAAGGNTLAFTPASAVHHIADEIERIYTQETLVANSAAVGETFDLLELQYGLNPTQFWINDFQDACGKDETQEIIHTYYGEKEDEFLERKCFGELTSKLAGAQMKRREGNITPNRETQRDLPTHVEIDPFHLRCESCERRPALFHEPKKLCEACARKYITGRATKKKIEGTELKRYTNRLKWSPASKGEEGKYQLMDWISLYNEYTKSGEEPDGPDDLADIAAASDKENYIAFIYADGNNMGAYLENIASPAQYRQFSERVFVAMQKAAFDALAKNLKPTKDNVHPFEIVSIGGDDLLLIVPGSNAFDIVRAIGVNFDKQFNSRHEWDNTKKDAVKKSQRYQSEQWVVDAQEMQPVFSMSLGFVIAEEHTPVAFLEHLADSLLKSAKSKAKNLIEDKIGYRGGTVDFLVLKSISMITSDLSDFRKNAYKTETENVLTMRPYTLHELDGFIKTVKDLKAEEFPRSQLYQLRKSIKLGRATSTLDYLYFRSRLKEGKGKLLQEQIEQNWHGISNSNNHGPWYQKLKAHENDDKKYETLLLDIIEAYEFIQKPEDNTRDNDID